MPLIRILGALVIGVIAMPPSAKPQDEPTKVWERMIAAKGGHDRLQQIRSFVVGIADKAPASWTANEIMPDGNVEQVFVLPDRMWQWADYRPGVMGFGVDLWFVSKRLFWTTQNGQPVRAIEWTPNIEVSCNYRMLKPQLLYFLETKHVRPKALRVTSAARGSLTIDVEVNGFARVTYTVDSATFLPRAVTLVPVLHNNDPTARRPGVAEDFGLQAYKEIAGLMLPTRDVGFGNLSFMINPDIDDALFQTDPSGVRVSGAWRKYLRR